MIRAVRGRDRGGRITDLPQPRLNRSFSLTLRLNYTPSSNAVLVKLAYWFNP